MPNQRNSGTRVASTRITEITLAIGTHSSKSSYKVAGTRDELVKGFMRRNDDCQAINNNTIHYTIDCPYTAKDSDNEKRRVDFKSYCESLKGHWYQRHDGPDLLEALPDEEAVQQALAVPKRYPPKLPSSPKYDEDGAKVEWEPNGNGDVKEDDLKETHGQSRKSDGETRRVGFEEDDVKITFVEEEL